MRSLRILIVGVAFAVAAGAFLEVNSNWAAGYALQQTNGSTTTWDALVEDYFDQGYFRFRPSDATLDGFHRYDSQLGPYSRSGITEEIETLHQYENRFAAVDPRTLNSLAAVDRELILSDIRNRLLTLEMIRPWQNNPDSYSSGITISAFVIMERHFAPTNERLASLIAREKQMPEALAAARKDLENPPRIYTEIALEQLPGMISMFEKDVPAAFADATDPALKRQFGESNKAVVTALNDYQVWLKSDVLARSKGDFRTGNDIFTKKLLYEDMVDIPLDRLLEIGTADLRKNQAEFARVARQIDANKTPRQVLQELADDHPSPSQLLQSFRDTFDSLISFIRAKQIVTIPSDVRPIVRDTPPYKRATSTASMDTPGPLETNSKEAFFNVTLPGPHDSPEEIKGRMEDFNRGTITSTSVHEAYPGHYMQFLFLAQIPTEARKILWTPTTGEGWAHYCEQMMLDEGYGQPGYGAFDAREAALIRLGQLEDALLRDARFIVGIQMHTGKMSFDQAVDFFVKEGYQTHEIGLVETKRGTSDPTYLYYTLGKLEILKLRSDVQRKQGTKFSLQKFHDDFLRQGFAPIKIIRQSMLGDNSPVL
jgi:uncharacterized protein (DUF885 family)